MRLISNDAEYDLESLRVKHGNLIHVGRDRSNDIVLLDMPMKIVSRRHAMLVNIQGGDYGVHPIVRCRNGVYVNNKRIHQFTLLRPGDELGFGGPKKIKFVGIKMDNPFLFRCCSESRLAL
jgi:pSer/pThr/pTyr-binding forkhead associated (FHA) protein